MISKWIALGLAFFMPLEVWGGVRINGPGVDLKTDKVVHIAGVITVDSMIQFGAEMIQVAELPGPLVIVINSVGGRVDAGAGMLRMMYMAHTTGVKLVCVVPGVAASMAFNIMSFCDERYAVQDAQMVVHKVESRLDPTIRSTAKNLRKWADQIDIVDEPWRQANTKAMHLTITQYDRYADVETIFTAAQLKRLGYLNAIVQFWEIQ